MSWKIVVETQDRKNESEYSSYDHPQQALEDGLRKMSSSLVGKEIREIVLTKN